MYCLNLFLCRILVCHQQARGRRRSSRPAGWFVKRKVPQVDQHLTQENIEFLKKAFEDEYKNLSSPLKNEPWPRNEWTPTYVNSDQSRKGFGD